MAPRPPSQTRIANRRSSGRMIERGSVSTSAQRLPRQFRPLVASGPRFTPAPVALAALNRNGEPDRDSGIDRFGYFDSRGDLGGDMADPAVAPAISINLADKLVRWINGMNAHNSGGYAGASSGLVPAEPAACREPGLDRVSVIADYFEVVRLRSASGRLRPHPGAGLPW